MTRQSGINKSILFFFPSVIDAIFIVILIGVIFISQGTVILEDGDTGYHTRTGHYILENLQVPTADFYSYTNPGKTWIAFSWGTDLIFGLVDKLAGLNGVVILSTLLIIGTLYIVYKLLMHWQINFSVIVLSVILVTAITSIHWLARPHLFTAIFCALIFYLLERAKENFKLYYFIPLIMIFWVNVHPGFIAGFFFLGLYFTGYIIQIFIDKDQAANYKQQLKYITFTGIASLLVTLINPYGINLYFYIHDTLSSYWIVNATNEYFSPDFHGAMAPLVYEFVLLAIIIFGYRHSRRVLDMPKILTLLFWTHLSLFAVRNLFIFAIVAVPCLAIILDSIIKETDWISFKKVTSGLFKTECSLKYHFWPLAIIVFSILIAANKGYFLGNRILAAHFAEDRLPVKAMKYYEKHPIEGNVFNQDNWGGFLIYSYPEIKVFMDGRLDMYQQKFLDEFQEVALIRPGWKKVFDKYKVRWIVYDKSTHLYNILINHPDWKLIYVAEPAAIFARKKK